jgi:kumamolisin
MEIRSKGRVGMRGLGSVRVISSVLSVALVAVGAVAAPVSAQAAAVPVPLSGTVPAAVAGARPVGSVAGSLRLSLQVDLPLRDFAGLETAIGRLSDPASPGYQRFLTPAQLTARYGPTAAQLGTVESYLRSAGITITSVSPQRNVIDAKATADSAERVFGVPIWRWHGADGQSFYAPRGNPVLPGRIARLILAVSGLDDLARAQPDSTTCTTQPSGGAPAGTCAEPQGVGNLGYTPAQLRRAYGVTRLMGSGLCPPGQCDGTGQNIGILEFGSSWSRGDVTQFDSQYGLSSPPAMAVCPKGVPCPIPESPGTPLLEADLDLEVAHAIAPAAHVIVYESPKDTVPVFASGLGDLLTTMLNNKTITTENSISYATCESDIGSSTAYALHQQFALLAMRGEVFFASSGDHGKYCHKNSTDVTGPSYPASDPLVTAVGGTNLLLNADGSYAYEYAWSESGGGSSTYSWNTRPAWQSVPGVPAGSSRLVPDVSADAYLSGYTQPGSDYDITGPGTSYPTAALGFSVCSPGNGASCWVSAGGTSAATPLWASVAAVYNQYATSAGKIPLNANVNAQLYDLAFRHHLHSGAITDVNYKAESGADLYENAAAGWDGATGAGSPQAYTMASDLPGLAIAPGFGLPGTAVTVTGSAFRPGETVTVADTTGSAATICSGTAAADGSFICTGKIPRTASYVPQRIVATGETSAGQAATAFGVIANTHFVYAADFGDGMLLPINTSTNAAGSEIPEGGAPAGIAISADGTTAYVTDDQTNAVVPVDLATGTDGAPISVGNRPSGIALTPNGAMAYAVSGNSTNVTPINLATGTTRKPITVGSYPQDIAITPNGATAYVTDFLNGDMTPIDLAANTAGTPIPVGPNAGDIAITPNGATAYVTTFATKSRRGAVVPIDLATGTRGTPIPVGLGPEGIAITPNGATAYVTNNGSASVTPINLATGTAGTPIPVDAGPLAITLTPNGAKAYVVSGNGVTPIDLATGTAQTLITDGNFPNGIASTYDGGI